MCVLMGYLVSEWELLFFFWSKTDRRTIAGRPLQLQCSLPALMSILACSCFLMLSSQLENWVKPLLNGFQSGLAQGSSECYSIRGLQLRADLPALQWINSKFLISPLNLCREVLRLLILTPFELCFLFGFFFRLRIFHIKTLKGHNLQGFNDDLASGSRQWSSSTGSDYCSLGQWSGRNLMPLSFGVTTYVTSYIYIYI